MTPHPCDRPIWTPPGLGHNGGPPLDAHVPEWGSDGIGTYFEWKRAHRRAWRRASRSVVMFRLGRAETVGLTYHEYTAEILDTGRYLQREDAARIAEIKRARTDASAAKPAASAGASIPRAEAADGAGVTDHRISRLIALKRQRPRWR
jgi:hypothetical protein